MRRHKKLSLLSWQQRRVLLYTFVIINTVRLLLWLFPFGMIRQQLRLFMSNWICRPQARLVSVSFIVKAVTIGARYSPGKPMCLARALTTQVLLNRYRYSCSLRIGVTKNSKQKLEAHAWIEHRGQVIVGNLSNLSQFETFTTGGVKI